MSSDCNIDVCPLSANQLICDVISDHKFSVWDNCSHLVSQYSTGSQLLSDCGPVNSFFYKARAQWLRNTAAEGSHNTLLTETKKDQAAGIT
jgi:hypothetical protein